MRRRRRRIEYPDELYHFGIKGMKWGVRKDRKAVKSRPSKRPKEKQEDSQLLDIERKYKHLGAYGGKAIRNPDGSITIAYKTFEDHLRDKRKERRQKLAAKKEKQMITMTSGDTYRIYGDQKTVNRYKTRAKKKGYYITDDQLKKIEPEKYKELRQAMKDDRELNRLVRDTIKKKGY